MPRQLQLTQNLLDRAATVWNVVYGTVSFLINFPSHFEAFVTTCGGLMWCGSSRSLC